MGYVNIECAGCRADARFRAAPAQVAAVYPIGRGACYTKTTAVQQGSDVRDVRICSRILSTSGHTFGTRADIH
jgi:hypothetical protein